MFVYKLDVDWYVEDSDSSIYDCQIGLSSVGSDYPDLLPFTSTHGHRHYTGYHNHLSDGTRYNVLIKATNRAGIETVQVGE